MADYKFQDIVHALKSVGMKEGDDVFMHTNLGFFGRCENVKSADELCATFFDAVRTIIGNEGTIIVPAFTYSSCHKEEFDPKTTKCAMGMFTDFVLKQPDTIRSLDPNFSVAANGGKAVFFTQNPPEKSFGDNCFFERFYKYDGLICNLNFDAGTTYVHYVEHKLNVPYRYDKQFKGLVRVGDKFEERVSYHFVYDRPADAPVFSRLHNLCIQNGVAKIEKLGKGVVLAERAKSLFNLIKETLSERPRFLLNEE